MSEAYVLSQGIFANITSIFGSSIIVIRVSGKKEKILDACQILKIDTSKLKHKEVLLSKIYKAEVLLDEALITFFESPHSFTGETCLEIAIHGSRFIFEEICKLLVEVGFRFAKNGEFSYRAFINGKMNLLEAEGMANLIASETSVQHSASIKQFTGTNTKTFAQLRESVLEVLSITETLIDFSDEDLPQDVWQGVMEKIEKTKIKISELLQNSSILSLNEGLKIALIGRPNSGKSSLFNKLCGKEKSIVSNIAGTTRDVIDSRSIIKGVPVIFYDTAGIRVSANDEIELEGMARAKEALLQSDIKLFIKDASSNESFAELAKELNFNVDQNTLFICNKSDLKKCSEGINVCALTGDGLEGLMLNIEEKLEQNFLPLINNGLVSSERQRILLSKSLVALSKITREEEIEIIAENLRFIANLLQEIIGKIDIEDILGDVFSKFCIGK